MRVAVLSTVYKSTPPSGYGGIERVVHTLVEELVRQGHQVTLFAAPGSFCSGETVNIPGYDPSKAPTTIEDGSKALTEEPLYLAVREYLEDHDVDVIHDWSFLNLFVTRHPERVPFVISTCIPPGPGYRRPNLVACSRAHAALCGKTARFVHYGLDLEKWGYTCAKKKHMVHISKIAKYKGQHLAILAARKAGKELLLAGNIEDRFYFYTRVKPLLMASPNVKYIGEINGTQSCLRDASALIQTPKWFDAFPLVVIESLASATPVIAFREGGIPEQIVDGITGFLCSGVDDLAQAMERVDEIRPQDCRAYAEEHFSARRMALEYAGLYESAVSGERW